LAERKDWLQGENEDPALVAMYRDLKTLTPQDRETIQMLMDRLKVAKEK
jgi:hypothetical protein